MFRDIKICVSLLNNAIEIIYNISKSMLRSNVYIMSTIYEAIKDVAKIAQKANNIDLYKKLIDISSDALDLQNKVFELSEENKKLRNKISEKENVVRHKDGLYVTVANEKPEIRYCSTCWGKDNKLIQLNEIGSCRICEERWHLSFAKS